jgi:hypothetical protein
MTAALLAVAVAAAVEEAAVAVAVVVGFWASLHRNVFRTWRSLR